MGSVCVKQDKQGSLYGSRYSKKQQISSSKTIQTRMDKEEYQRLKIIRDLLQNGCNKNLQSKQNIQDQREISDFKFIRPLGEGAYGQVLMVKDKKSQKFYAMKIVKKQLIIERDQILNALSERYILAAMDHPFVVKLHYAFQTKNKIYLIVDLMAGGQLFYLLRKKKRFEQSTARFYAAQVLLALQYLHSKKIIYRDLKPENILLTIDGHIKLTDFGLSKVCLKNNQLALSICGTPQYVAPEVLKGKGYTSVADWFSFGSLLYDMLTGKPPFYSKDKQDMMKKIQTKQIPFPDYLTSSAKSLLMALFSKKQQNRLGYKNDAQQIKSHQFFKSINFDDILNKKVKPPFQFSKKQDFFNSQGFANKIDSFDVQQSFQNQLVHQSKGVNFQGFTYQNYGIKTQKFESKNQIGYVQSYKDKQNGHSSNQIKDQAHINFSNNQLASIQYNKGINNSTLNPMVNTIINMHLKPSYPEQQIQLQQSNQYKTPIKQQRSSLSMSFTNNNIQRKLSDFKQNQNDDDEDEQKYQENQEDKNKKYKTPSKIIQKQLKNVSFGTIKQENCENYNSMSKIRQ